MAIKAVATSGGSSVVDGPADDVFARVREQLGVACEVEVRAVGRDPEHEIRDRVEQRLQPQLGVQAPCSPDDNGSGIVRG